MSIEVGDLVHVSRNVSTPTVQLTGLVGRVRCIKDGHCGVVFDQPIGGGDLEGHCVSPYGFYVNPQFLQKMIPLKELLRKQWSKEWEPKLKRIESQNDSIIFIEDET